MRRFETGATRNDEAGKLDYEAFLSPLVIKRFGQYMHHHRFQADGEMRDGDNWQKGILQESYIKSAWRHFMDWWLHWDGYDNVATEDLEDAICALIFNAQGFLHEHLKAMRTLPEKATAGEIIDALEITEEEMEDARRAIVETERSDE